VGIPSSNIRSIRLVFAFFVLTFFFFHSPLPLLILTTNLFTIQGISPTLLYPVPTREESWLLSKIIHSVRDYYPLWQVFFFFFKFLILSFDLNLFQPPNSSYTEASCSYPVRQSLSGSLRYRGNGSRFLHLCRRSCWWFWGWKPA